MACGCGGLQVGGHPASGTRHPASVDPAGVDPRAATHTALAAVGVTAETREMLVKWRGRWWAGVPMPLRWRLARLAGQRYGTPPRWRVCRSLPGCGCPIRWRLLVDRLLGPYATERVHRLLRDLPRGPRRVGRRLVCLVHALEVGRDREPQPR